MMGSVIFNEASIQAKVAAWSRSSSGHAKIASVLDHYISTGQAICQISGNVVTKEQMVDAGQHLKALLISHSSDLPASLQSLVAGVEVGVPTGGNGQYIIELSFPGDLARPSLVPSYYTGVDNILALFNNGYNASNFVFGLWNGHYTGSKMSRLGNHFVPRACAAFNSMYGGQYHATAQPGGQYK